MVFVFLRLYLCNDMCPQCKIVNSQCNSKTLCSCCAGSLVAEKLRNAVTGFELATRIDLDLPPASSGSASSGSDYSATDESLGDESLESLAACEEPSNEFSNDSWNQSSDDLKTAELELSSPVDAAPSPSPDSGGKYGYEITIAELQLQNYNCTKMLSCNLVVFVFCRLTGVRSN